MSSVSTLLQLSLAHLTRLLLALSNVVDSAQAGSTHAREALLPALAHAQGLQSACSVLGLGTQLPFSSGALESQLT